MEFDFKKVNPDYFNEAYWCDAWMLETLADEEFDRMAAFIPQLSFPSPTGMF